MQEFRVNRTRKIEIIRKDRLAGAFCHRIDFAERFADDRQMVLLHDISRFLLRQFSLYLRITPNGTRSFAVLDDEEEYREVVILSCRRRISSFRIIIADASFTRQFPSRPVRPLARFSCSRCSDKDFPTGLDGIGHELGLGFSSNRACSGQQNSGDAITALRRAEVGESVLQRMGFTILRHSFDGDIEPTIALYLHLY